MKNLRTFIFALAALTLLPFGLFSQSNQYLHFDMEDDFVQLPNASQYIANSTGFSMTGWFNCDALAYGQGMMGFRATAGGFYMIQLNNGTIECRFVNSSNTLFEYVAPANTVIPQIWQHFAWVYDGSTVSLYVNGFLKGSHAASGTITNPGITFAIGKSLLSSFNFVYGGGIDEITVWNKGLTQAEVQDIMNNECTGTEPNLVLYYKFNQGVPGGNNTAITKLVSEVDPGNRDADLMNFAMTGDSSNFVGTINPGFQAISFPQVPTKLISDPPFTLGATASSNLPVEYEILSGPATLGHDTLYLTGAAGDVVVRATQPGNAQYGPAVPVVNTFSVLDPATHTPDIDPRSPLAGDVYVPVLKPIQLAAIATITAPELFSVLGVSFTINGTSIPAIDHGEGHYTAWWQPPHYGDFSIMINATNNYGFSGWETVSINVTSDTTDMEVTAVQNVWLYTDIPTATVEAELPSFLGAFDKVTATLEANCPLTGGCGDWDHIMHLEVQGHDGLWRQIIRYITPYGTPCSHNIDLTDFMTLLEGKVAFRLSCGTLDNGYVYKLILHYSAGIPEHPYSTVNKVWEYYYPFGDMANLQPVETFNFAFPTNAAAAKLKLVSTGHGWDHNTGEAAEFYDATHHIWVNNQQTFEQHNWQACNPNPDGCQPQSGTWAYPRAGWCPGSIAQWFGYDMSPYIAGQNVELKYIFYEDYVDLCHPNNPNCVTGVTCDDCMDGFNPALDVACHLVVFADNPITSGLNENYSLIDPAIAVYPNPSTGMVTLTPMRPGDYRNSVIRILSITGKVMEEFNWSGEEKKLNLSGYSKGIYFLEVKDFRGIGMKKFMLM